MAERLPPHYWKRASFIRMESNRPWTGEMIMGYNIGYPAGKKVDGYYVGWDSDWDGNCMTQCSSLDTARQTFAIRVNKVCSNGWVLQNTEEGFESNPQ